MKSLRIAFCIWLIFGCVWAVLGKGKAKPPEKVIRTVQHLKVKLRQDHSHTSDTVSDDFQYLTQFEVLETLGIWLRVRPLEGDVEGWILASRLMNKKVHLEKPPDSEMKRLRKGEGDLAAPGFRPTIEQQYRQETPGLEESFAWLDQLEERDAELLPSIEDLVRFRQEGQLRPLDGGGS